MVIHSETDTTVPPSNKENIHENNKERDLSLVENEGGRLNQLDEGGPHDELSSNGSEDRMPAEAFPPFDDPAFSPDQVSPAPSAANNNARRKDPVFAGHPEFSQDAAKNESPALGVGNSRATPSPDTLKVSGAGPAIAEHSKDAKAPKSGRQPGAYVKE